MQNVISYFVLVVIEVKYDPGRFCETHSFVYAEYVVILQLNSLHFTYLCIIHSFIIHHYRTTIIFQHKYVL